MTEPVSDAEIVTAVKERFDCAHAAVALWMDETGRELVAAMVTKDQRPGSGSAWTLIAALESREALLLTIQKVAG